MMENLESVLIVGSGAREHAMLEALMRCDRPLCVYAYPGNAGMENDGCSIVNEAIDGWQDLAFWAVKNEIDLTIVGPEIPLVDGIVDIFQKHGLVIFGPTKKAARIEGSKVFAKELMKKYKIPTADFRIFSDQETALKHLKDHGTPIVIKVDGLAAGKGAFVCNTMKEAESALHHIFDKKAFGEAGGAQVVLEEKMEGEEASVFVLSDGISYKILPVAQDHKRVGDGDTGPNTGGMGAYSPCPLIDTSMLAKIEKEIIVPTIKAMKKEGAPFTGLLYIGIMVTKSGPKVVEFNCRFGDPETQAMFPLINCDWFEVFKACSGVGKFSLVKLTIKPGFCVAVVLASGGYPGKYEKGKVISGIADPDVTYPKNVDIYHAGTIRNEKDEFQTNGGRVLTVSACEDSLKKAIKTAYKVAEQITFEGKIMRHDIGVKGLAFLEKSKNS
jgi:phosphoribosylamine---glycine ligase